MKRKTMGFTGNRLKKKLKNQQGASIAEMLFAVVLIGFIYIMVCSGILTGFSVTQRVNSAAYGQTSMETIKRKITAQIENAVFRELNVSEDKTHVPGPPIQISADGRIIAFLINDGDPVFLFAGTGNTASLQDTYYSAADEADGIGYADGSSDPMQLKIYYGQRVEINTSGTTESKDVIKATMWTYADQQEADTFLDYGIRSLGFDVSQTKDGIVIEGSLAIINKTTNVVYGDENNNPEAFMIKCYNLRDMEAEKISAIRSGLNGRDFMKAFLEDYSNYDIMDD